MLRNCLHKRALQVRITFLRTRHPNAVRHWWPGRWLALRASEHRLNAYPLLNLDFDDLGLGVTGGVRDGQRIRCCFFRSDIDTAGVGGPDGIRLRLKRDRFG